MFIPCCFCLETPSHIPCLYSASNLWPLFHSLVINVCIYICIYVCVYKYVLLNITCGVHVMLHVCIFQSWQLGTGPGVLTVELFFLRCFVLLHFAHKAALSLCADCLGSRCGRQQPHL